MTCQLIPLCLAIALLIGGHACFGSHGPLNQVIQIVGSLMRPGRRWASRGWPGVWLLREPAGEVATGIGIVAVPVTGFVPNFSPPQRMAPPAALGKRDGGEKAALQAQRTQPWVDLRDRT